ncbi:hypothetical protein FE810_07640 [Thalassotalea litorea]|uniref:D-glucuronyl C5-epimerase C-terminal domain-containing protein n=1 Tax=Thalassotalea litorea TaxID=2020715 RepID=A0A5R9IJS3_9GAMM|nr:hypothetical protein [Thalassotalea litorea]TLU65775.1 hypothetical protein FE810_07640 [Thalassotalea litorea]
MKHLWLWLFAILFSLSSLKAIAEQPLRLEVLSANSGNQFTIPVPRNKIFLHSSLQLQKYSQDKFTPVKGVQFSYTLLWPNADKASDSIRALIVKLQEPVKKGDMLQLRFDQQSKEKIKPWKETPATLIDVSYSSGWLENALYAPLQTQQSGPPSWFDFAYRQFGYQLADMETVNQDPKVKRNYTTSAPWLYDRVYVLYQLYFQTGDLYFKQMAHVSAQVYRSHINEFGYFSLKKGNDIKYLLAPGMLIDYQFYPSNDTAELIHQFYQNSLRWPAQYQLGLTFWTERNLSVALANAISLWELTQSVESFTRIEALIKGSMRTLQTSQNKNLNCLAHPYRVHEGKSDNTLVCSPWMNALLAHQLWKLWRMTEMPEAAQLISAFGKNVVEQGSYLAPKGKIKGLTVPKYLIFAQSSKFEDPMAYSDMQHACDVAGLVVSARYLALQLQQDQSFYKDTMENLLLSCRASLGVDKKKNSWRIKPLRKFNWWFHSTGNLSWKLAELDEYERTKAEKTPAK